MNIITPPRVLPQGLPIPVGTLSPNATGVVASGSSGSGNGSLASLPFPMGSLTLSSSPPLGGFVGPLSPVKIPQEPVPMRTYSTENQRTKVLLLENVSQTAIDLLTKAGFEVDSVKDSLADDVLIERLKGVHAVGIRSKTNLTANIIQNAKSLAVIGCFCIGTNQVDLDTAQQQGVPVFNSPFSNSRSVGMCLSTLKGCNPAGKKKKIAELTISEIVALARHLGDKTLETKNLVWNSTVGDQSANNGTATGKAAKPNHAPVEIRGKTLGIVGYGHIGSQLSVLAEAMGMRVLFSDIVPMMPLGTARQVPTLEVWETSSRFFF